MRLPQSKLQNVKIGLHATQALLIFIAMCIMFALFAQPDGKHGGSDSRNRYYIALVFITIPLLILQVGLPLWSRTQRYSNTYAFLAIDALLSIFWLAAFASVASWVHSGIALGAQDAKIAYSQANCTTFGLGNEEKCRLGNAATGFGVVVCLLCIGAASISAVYVMRSRRDPAGEQGDPWLAKDAVGRDGTVYKATPGGLEDGRQSKDPIWDHNYAGPEADAEPEEYEHGDEGLQASAGYDHEGEDDYAPLHSTETEDGRHPGRRWDTARGPAPIDTGYHGAGTAGNYRAPSALSPASYGHPTPGGGFEEQYDGSYRPPPRYTFSPAEPIPIPDPGDASRD